MHVSGPTMAGKSTFVLNLLKDKSIFDKQPAAIYWYYGGQSTEGLEEGLYTEEWVTRNFFGCAT